jgi:hypothetical protein
MDLQLRGLKMELSMHFRAALLARDGTRCRACAVEGDHQVAHITSARAFCKRMGYTPQAIRASYRMDNLVLLCKPCHGAQTLGAKRIEWTRTQLGMPDSSFEHKCAVNRLRTWDLVSIEDAQQHQRRVASLFGKLQRRRGWLSAIDLVRGRTWNGLALPVGVALDPVASAS